MDVIEHFYRTHDPTTVNRQGGDTGTQYRSGIYTHTPEQAKIAKEVTEKVQAEHFSPKGQKIVTEIQEAGTWYDAEVIILSSSSQFLITTRSAVPLSCSFSFLPSSWDDVATNPAES